MEVLGKPTINPLIFFSGKVCGYLTWIIFFLSLGGVPLILPTPFLLIRIASYGLLGLGIVFIVFSSINLGNSLRLGLPSHDTVLKNKGIYRISRNPMYVGFNLFTLAAIAETLNIFVLVMGIYSIIVYHFIILGEEGFLEERFGSDYLTYKKQVRRYL